MVPVEGRGKSGGDSSGMLRLVLTIISVAVMTVVLAACGDDAPVTAPPEVATPPTAVPPSGEREARVLTPSGSEGVCDVTPRQTEGPYYLDVGQVRRDITEGKLGTPLLVRLHLVEAGSCAPIGDASVDIWHTDAAGQYSGFGGQGDDGADTSGETFLRGTQITDANGLVEFETVYPGWYPGRTAHIHFKAYTDEGSLVSSQMYFPDHISDAVYAAEPYSVRGVRRTTNDNDGLTRNPASRALLGNVMESGDGYVVSMVVGVER